MEYETKYIQIKSSNSTYIFNKKTDNIKIKLKHHSIITTHQIQILYFEKYLKKNNKYSVYMNCKFSQFFLKSKFQ